MTVYPWQGRRISGAINVNAHIAGVNHKLARGDRLRGREGAVRVGRGTEQVARRDGGPAVAVVALRR